MIALVKTHKGLGKICQYKVTFRSGWQNYFFVAFGVSGKDVMRHTLEGNGMVLAHREDNDVRALITDHEDHEKIKYINKVWG